MIARSRVSLRRWVGAAAGVLTILAGISLGAWQLRRADEKAQAQAARDAALREPARIVPPQLVPASALDGHRAVAQGRLLAHRTVFIDNRSHRGVAGLHVVTPLELAPGGAVVLVLRGWVARDPHERDRLPDVPTPAHPVRIEGLAQSDIGRSLELPGLFGRGESAPARWPSAVTAEAARVWSNVDVARYANWSGLAVQPVILRQASELDDGLVRAWSSPGDDVARHRAYAVQWFGLAATAAVFVLLGARGAQQRMPSRRRRPRQASDASPNDDEHGRISTPGVRPVSRSER